MSDNINTVTVKKTRTPRKRSAKKAVDLTEKVIAGAAELQAIAESPKENEDDKTVSGPASSRGSDSNDFIYISCALANGIKFDDVDNGAGGVKTVVIPGHNHGLRGPDAAILQSDGHAVLYRILRKDWLDIVKKHGRERAFTAVPPFLREIKDKAQFESKSMRDEIKDTRTGVQPRKPEDFRVEKAKISE